MMDQEKLGQLMGKVMVDFGGAMSAVLVRIGAQTGLFAGLAEAAALSDELAERTGTSERYVREWLAAMAAAGYVTYDRTTKRFSLSPEQRAIFAESGTPVYLPPFADMLLAVAHDEPSVTRAFRTGEGIPWSDRHVCLFCGADPSYRPNYSSFLLSEWLPALDGVVDRLNAGGRVADIGCGHGLSTLMMAKAFPRSHFFGFDFDMKSIETARKQAAETGLSNVEFAVATAKTFAGAGYDLVTIFDALHDMGDPVGAARHILASLKSDGTWMVVEPMAGEDLEDNLHALGPLMYGASTCICIPTSRAQEVGLALGAQAGEARLSEVIREGGFTRVSRAAGTPSNLVLEARP